MDLDPIRSDRYGAEIDAGDGGPQAGGGLAHPPGLVDVERLNRISVSPRLHLNGRAGPILPPRNQIDLAPTDPQVAVHDGCAPPFEKESCLPFTQASQPTAVGHLER